MSLSIIEYPHPTLRHISKPLKRVDAELRRIIDAMFERMYEAEGIGLAANQVDLPYRLFVLNLTSDPAQKDEQLVFINPVITQRKGTSEGTEGCLSLPGLYAPVRRADKIVVTAYNLAGQEIEYEAGDLFAKAVQHELDHLDGILFIDRLTEAGKLAVKARLQEFEEHFAHQRETGEIPSDESILSRLAELEKLRT